MVGRPRAGNGNRQDDHDETIQNRDQITVRRKLENIIATHHRPKKGRQGNSIPWDDTKCISGGAVLKADAAWPSVGNHTPRKTVIDAPVAIQSDATSAGSSTVETRHQKSKPMPYNFCAPHSDDHDLKGGKRVGDSRPAYLQSSTPNT